MTHRGINKSMTNYNELYHMQALQKFSSRFELNSVEINPSCYAGHWPLIQAPAARVSAWIAVAGCEGSLYGERGEVGAENNNNCSQYTLDIGQCNTHTHTHTTLFK